MKKVKAVVAKVVVLLAAPELRPIETRVARVVVAALLAYLGVKAGTAAGV